MSAPRYSTSVTFTDEPARTLASAFTSERALPKTLQGLASRISSPPATLWVAATLKDSLAKAGIPFMDPSQVLTYHLAFVLKKYSADFIGIQETKFLLASMEARFPDLVKEATRVLPIQKIAEILQRLVSEDISVRNLRTVLEALIEWGQKEKDSVLLTEYVRSSL